MSPSQPIEYEGKNVDQAVEAACRALDLPKERLRYRIVSHGSTGIFGIVGAKKARIRVDPASEERPAAGSPPAPASAETPPAGNGPDDLPPDFAAGGDVTAAEAPDGEEDGRLEDAKAEGKEMLERLLAHIRPESEIETSLRSGRIHFHIRGGEDAALLIGKRGQTLEAIQYLLEKMINRRFEGRVKVLVDVEGYRKNKRENLRQLAYKMAEKAKRSGKPASVGQMNAHDRRIVHIALKEDRAVRTQSVGEGAMRKLLIFPKKVSSSRNRTQKAR